MVAGRFASLVGTARRAGAGADAEDVVQEVVTRFLEEGRALPEQADALAAYLHRSVARDSARRRSRGDDALRGEPADPAPEPADALEDRRRIRAYARALERLPDAVRPVLLLDVAGLDRATIARRTGLSERSVKRVLAENAGAVLAEVVAEIDGTACARLTETLQALAVNGLSPRVGGATARHLEVCDACRLAYLEVRRTRTAVGSVLLLPAGLARKATTALLGRAARTVVHARRAVVLPAVASLSAVVPLVAFPHLDRVPGHTARPRAAGYVAAPAESPPPHAAARIVARPVAPASAEPTPRRPRRRPARKVVATAPRHVVVRPAPPPPSPPVRSEPAASGAACAFGSATIGC